MAKRNVLLTFVEVHEWPIIDNTSCDNFSRFLGDVRKTTLWNENVTGSAYRHFIFITYSNERKIYLLTIFF